MGRNEVANLHKSSALADTNLEGCRTKGNKLPIHQSFEEAEYWMQSCSPPARNTTSHKLNVNSLYIVKQCAFIHMGPENVTMRCPNLVQIQTQYESSGTRLGTSLVKCLSREVLVIE